MFGNGPVVGVDVGETLEDEFEVCEVFGVVAEGAGEVVCAGAP